MHNAADDADFVVLNGDVFDFRWTTLPAVDDTVPAAADWLHGFVRRHPRCRVFYVMGNHDNLRPFADRLSDLASAADNFQWHSSHVRIGDALFAHGDRFFVDRSGNPFSRQLAPVVRKRHGAFSRGYRLLHRLRVHKWHAPVYPHWRCVKRIARVLRRAAHPDAAGVRHVYFGHTHRPFTDYRHDGVAFHNTGSAIAGLRWNMLPVEIEPAVESLPAAAG